METSFFETIGKIAGIGGIALGVFLLLFREVIRKNIFPNLTKLQAYKLFRLIVILVWSIALTGILAWVYLTKINQRTTDPNIDTQIIESRKRAFKEARNAMENGKPIIALQVLDQILKEEPGNLEISKYASTAAEGYIDYLLDTQSAQEALNWLRKELNHKPYLELLRSRIPKLDTLATIDYVLVSDKSIRTKLLEELVGRYPRDPTVPYNAAYGLEGKIYDYDPVWLYELSLERGADADSHIFDFCLQLFAYYPPTYPVIEKARHIVITYFRNAGVEWAYRALDEDESGRILSNAWWILKEIYDTRIKDAYYQSLYQLTYGYQSRDEADTALQIFISQNGQLRRKHIIAVHRWVLKPFKEKGVGTWGYQHKDFVESNLEELTTHWGIP
jgi:hypothetical protein